MLAIKDATIHTINRGVIPKGAVLVDGGKIVAVGPNVDIPAGAEVIEAAGCVLTPGLIDAHCHLGISEEGIGFEGEDTNEMTEPITPHMRAVDGINPEDSGLRDAVEAGVTAAWVAPGSGNVIGGQACTIRTFGRTVDDMVLVPFAGLKAALGENPKRVYNGKSKMPMTRMGTAALFRENFYKARDYMRKQEKAQAGGDPVDVDLKLEPIAAVLRREVPLRIHCHRADDIMTALRLAREFDIELCLEHATEGHKIADKLAAEPRLKGVTIGPTMSTRSKYELRDKTWDTVHVVHDAGVKTAVITDHPVVSIQYLALSAGYAAKAGLERDEALRAITQNAADIALVGDRLGSIEAGKDADLALFTGHPLEMGTETVATIVAGHVAYRNPKFSRPDPATV